MEDDDWVEEELLPFDFVKEQMESVIPGPVVISEDAVNAARLCISEFVAFVTGEFINSRGFGSKIKMNGEDVITVMAALGFEEYIMPLQIYTKKMRKFRSAKTKVLSYLEEIGGGKKGDCNSTKVTEEENEEGSGETEENGDGEFMKGIVEEGGKNSGGAAEEAGERFHARR